ncbi:HK97 family phage prohead protease [Cohnella cholangitidis]|uniref:HK97 family phage prohead protease n=1 Tax=Cohnella cholangitidis TaxID=2598458 RepID=A0A7G5C3F0_9BACL|nr:HK97 family phage prohead protease [Cohnella cholangitidis]QMV43734.1 HK97 family phage prohead protease [Cohnella cholangitidis]
MKTKENKTSPLMTRTKRKVAFKTDESKFRAIAEEADGKQVRRLRGYPILFGVPGRPWRSSEWVEKVDRTALEGVDFSNLVILLDHNTNWVLGRYGKNLKAVVDDIGLFVEVTLGNTWMDDYVFDRVEREIVDGMSFWFDSKSIIASDWTNKIDVVVKINEVYEVSIVTFPAYEETVIIAETGEGELADPPEDDDSETTEEEVRKQALLALIDQL